jgi:hypothetical protein
MRNIWNKLLFLSLLIASSVLHAQSRMEQYNVTWNSQSKNSSESMPVGGHSIGVNAWVENGDILFYAQRSGSFTEHNEYQKLGRFRLQLKPNPFKDGDSFRQELKLHEGYVEIVGEKNGIKAKVNLWVEAKRPVVHMDVSSDQNLEAVVSYESWRFEEQKLKVGLGGERFGCYSLVGYSGDVIRSADVVNHDTNSVLFYHRNPDDKLLLDYMIKQQQLEDVGDEIINTQKGRTFGGRMVADGFVKAGTGEGKYIAANYKSWKLKSSRSRKKHEVRIYTHIDQTKSLSAWKKGLSKLVAEKKNDARKETLAWWDEFWKRSWLMINPSEPNPKSKAWQIARNYQLFRYQLGCNAYGEYPTKFNGGNFTFDPSLVLKAGNDKRGKWKPDPTPDWRSWGGGSFTAQNQRLLYWPMLKTGDFDAMKPQFEFYRRALPGAVARVKAYWGHEGACFTEQIENFGLPIASAYGYREPKSKNSKRPQELEPGSVLGNAISKQYQSQLEFSYMIMEWHRYTGSDISPYMEFIKQSLKFYYEHYQMRYRKEFGHSFPDKGKGDLVIYPSTACERAKGALNPTDVVSGLYACLESVLKLPANYITTKEKDYFKTMQKRIPDYSYEYKEDGKKVIKVAQGWHIDKNTSEFPQFYPLFPFNQFELGVDDMTPFINSFELDTHWRKNQEFKGSRMWSWHQDGIFMARMGKTKLAKGYALEKMKDAPRRFPTFWGPGHDWTPDHNWGGSGMIGLQEMLMQTISDKILLFPAWPKEWDVDFKLHAPQNTTVEGRLENGKVKDLKVTPESRKKDVVNMLNNAAK